jgi:hypothetical protein
MPFAPARFSTVTLWPQSGVKFSASNLAVMSETPPGG